MGGNFIFCEIKSIMKGNNLVNCEIKDFRNKRCLQYLFICLDCLNYNVFVFEVCVGLEGWEGSGGVGLNV